MPLFFFISGYLLAYNGWTSNKDYSSFIKIKVKRLLLPYFFWNIVFFIPKYLVQGYLSDDISISLSYITKIFFTFFLFQDFALIFKFIFVEFAYFILFCTKLLTFPPASFTIKDSKCHI